MWVNLYTRPLLPYVSNVDQLELRHLLHATMRPNMKRSLLSAFFILLAIAPGAQAAEPVRLIFDTDIGNDIDDALALGLIQALESRSEVQLLAVTITKDNVWA